MNWGSIGAAQKGGHNIGASQVDPGAGNNQLSGTDISPVPVEAGVFTRDSTVLSGVDISPVPVESGIFNNPTGATPKIMTLIDKNDNFEIVRDQIAAILSLESAYQQVLAESKGKDPDLWKLRVFIERSNPWEQYLNSKSPIDESPIVNIWYDHSQFNPSTSNGFERQKAESIFNIDCYGYAVSEDNPDGGHLPGDEYAARAVQRAVKLCRNILMSAPYLYLDLQGLVWGRSIQSTQAFQPESSASNVQQVQAVRIAFNVGYNEFAPQGEEETLKYVAIDINRAENGEILVEADYDYS